ncbi:putative hydrolase [Kitasatospora cheerisanensis KCTC 2395]|uniref:Putative hydrolase n=2 Tax=Kitasatospora cheerisanensis TaxID=81942 RepID=A0A066YUQ0_9ACTN|nr:putative hydrolase [Kitasatospora cheerisanensis KCTC 2395]
MLGMPLLLLDLDNTLLPRDAAFRAWAEDFLAENNLPAGDLDWLVMLDGSGYVPRSTVLGAAKRRYGIDRSVESMLGHYRLGINSHINCPDSHVRALREAREAGWTLGIVSNGGTRPQLEKIRLTGLAAMVDGWVISEEARCVKPDPLIFEIAARRCGFRPAGDWTAETWMVGDYGPADIAGAEATGLRSVWLHHGRPWAERGYRPTVSAPDLPEAVRLILGAAERPTAARGFAAAPGRKRPPRTRLAVPASRLAPSPTSSGPKAPFTRSMPFTGAVPLTPLGPVASPAKSPATTPSSPATASVAAAVTLPTAAQARWSDASTAAG